MTELRYTLRRLAHSPAFTTIVVLTLALGIGANSAIFSVVNGVLIEPLPFADADRLVQIGHEYRKMKVDAPVDAPGYFDYTAQNAVFSSTAIVTGWNANLTGGGGEPERLIGSRVTASYFPTYGVETQRGRGFRPDEEQLGNHRVAVISDGLWRRRFGASPGITDTTITLNNEAYRIIGVMRPGFRISTAVDVWTPLAFTPEQRGARFNEYLGMVGRLKPGVTLEQARADLSRIAASVRREYMDSTSTEDDWTLSVTPLREGLFGDVRPALLVLLGAVGFVLLIACANVANLLLARAASRERELAIRIALGAGRGRLVRELLTETVVLALLGGIGGVLLAVWATDTLVALQPANIPRLHEIAVDGRVLAFTFGISLVTGILFGLFPALQASKPDLHDVMKEGTRAASPAFGRGGIRRLLVAAEVALALVLLIGAGLMVRSFGRVQGVNPGFEPAGTLAVQMSIPPSKYPTEDQQRAFQQRVLQEVRALPGVQGASFISNIPMSGSISTGGFEAEGWQPPTPSDFAHGDIRIASTGYFETLRIPLLQGRTFDERDVVGSAPVAIIDETLARKHWPNENPIGKRVGRDVGDSTAWRTVIGMVGHVQQLGVTDVRRTQLYFAMGQQTFPGLSLLVRGSGDPADLTPAVRAAIRRVDADQPLYNIRPMTEVVAASRAGARFSALLLSLFAALAAVLAAIGIYGVMSYSVSQRTHELGIRMALGAERQAVLGLVLRQGMLIAGAGIVVGLAGAFALTRLVERQLYDVSPSDPLTYTLVALGAGAVALVATYLPAARATRVDPTMALRSHT
jgi:putative ABC transport system permease protein